MSKVSFEMLQTMVRKAFDPVTISVTIGKAQTDPDIYRATVRDEISKLAYTFHVNQSTTVADVYGYIQNAAQHLNLIEGPEKIGDQIVDHPTEEGGM